MVSLVKRLTPALSSMLLATALSGCCVVQEGAYCVKSMLGKEQNNQPIRRNIIASPQRATYTNNTASKPISYDSLREELSYSPDSSD
ncbi:MAG: hypothetical protein Q8Q31_05465 [Nanoarchaeota archaeon]|nr:hypothetical protein [Nanoarchaeota archaeon]